MKKQIQIHDAEVTEVMGELAEDYFPGANTLNQVEDSDLVIELTEVV